MKRKFIFAHMETAWVYSKLSHCERLKVGAVIVKNGNQIAHGYNGRPSGEPNIGEVDGCTHPDVIHAESNALRKITKSSESSSGAAVFVTHSPCRKCAIEIAESEIKTVLFCENYRDPSGLEYLINHGVGVYQIDMKLRTIYRAIDGGNGYVFLSQLNFPEIEV